MRLWVRCCGLMFCAMFVLGGDWLISTPLANAGAERQPRRIGCGHSGMSIGEEGLKMNISLPKTALLCFGAVS